MRVSGIKGGAPRASLLPQDMLYTFSGRCILSGEQGELLLRNLCWRMSLTASWPLLLLSLTPSPVTRRSAISFGCAGFMGAFSRSASAAAVPGRQLSLPPPESECLSCKLKATLTDGQPALGTDIGDLLSPAPKLAVKDVIDVGRDPLTFEATLQRVLAQYDPEKARVLVWIQSELVNGVPWCSDTRAALPLLESALYRASGDQPIVLVTADVVRGDYYEKGYPYRINPLLKLSGVPTLYRWGREGPVKRVQERQITPASLDSLIA